MDIFEFIFNEDDESNSGVFAMSMVNKPAMKSSYVLLSENKVLLKVQDKKKKILTGVALMPDVLIPRLDPKTGETYQAFFSKDTIEKTSQKFLQDFNQKNVTVEHMLSVNDCSVVESWIKSDDKLDKSVSLGIDAPVGSWLMTLKVENDELWDGLIETGLLTGFSIEGNYQRKPVTSEFFTESKINKEKMEKSEMNVIKAIREMFLGKDTVVEAADMPVDMPADAPADAPVEKETVTYELTVEEMKLIEAYRKVQEESKPADDIVEPVEASELVEASEVSDATVETVVEPVAETVEETPAEPVAETPAEAPATVADVAEQIKPEVEPQMIPLTDAETSARNKKVKFNNKLTVQERIKLGLGTLDI